MNITLKERSQTEYGKYEYSDLICIENIDLNVFTVIADFTCSGILFQIGALSDCRVRFGKYDLFFGWATGFRAQMNTV